jgi:HEPN domain-containing protein
MTRADLKNLAGVRITEARQLLDTGHFSGAYYLAGYSIELALKACIAKKTMRYDFPELMIARDSFTHDLTKLVKVARLEKELVKTIATNRAFEKHWRIVLEWNVDSRYRDCSKKEAENIISSITATKSGILQWFKQHW